MTNTKASAPARKPWVRPVVEKIAAGQAEVSTRTAADGPFSAS